jgi:hypothetical protein
MEGPLGLENIATVTNINQQKVTSSRANASLPKQIQGFSPNTVTPQLSGFDGLGVSMLASGTQIPGFEPSRSRRIFQGEKSSTCLRFSACKRSLQIAI